MPAHQATSRGGWMDRLLAERQIYIRGRGQPYFVTVTRRARVRRALALLTLILTTAAMGTALGLGYQRYQALDRELAALRAAPQTAAGDDLARLRAALEAKRSGRAQAEAELAQEREAGKVASRARDAELEAARARMALLSGQLQSAEQARQAARGEAEAANRRIGDLQAMVARANAETTRLSDTHQATEAAQVETASLRGERDRLGQRVAVLEAQLRQATEQGQAARDDARTQVVAENERLKAQNAELAAARQQLQAELDRAEAEAGQLQRDLDAATARVVPAAVMAATTPIPTDAAAAIAAAKGGQGLPGQVSAAQDHVRELEAQLAELQRRNQAMESYLGRRAPSPPATAPR